MDCVQRPLLTGATCQSAVRVVLAMTDAVISPCTVSIYLETEQDLQDFLQWIQTPDALPLNEDHGNYTDCDYEWTVAEMVEFEGY